MPEPISNIFDLIRREGLIVIALGALLWQVHWLTNNFSAADMLWREEINAYRVSADNRAQDRMQATAEMTRAVSQMADRLTTIERILADAEEECLMFGAKEKIEALKDE